VSSPTQPAGPYDPNLPSNLPAGAGTAVPTDSTGALNVWNLPAWVLQYESSVNKTPFFMGGKTTYKNQTVDRATEYSEQVPLAGQGNGPAENSHKVGTTKNNYASAEQLMKQFTAMAVSDPAQFAATQKLLLEGGWYGSVNTQVQYGMNPQTESAIASAMVQYLKAAHGADVPTTFQDFLTGYAQNNAGIGNVPGQGGSTTPISLTDPNALRQSAEQAAQAALGHGFSDDQLQRFVSEFQSRQSAAQTQQGGSVEVPDQSADANAFAQQSDEQGYSNHQAEAYTNAFLNMFLPNGSARPNIAPVSKA
jgi:hypothetical protein